MYLFHLEVPPGADAVEASLDYVSPAETGGFSSGSSATSKLALISWNQLLLYPKRTGSRTTSRSRRLCGCPRVEVRDRARGRRSSVGRECRFAPVSLTTLVDSPVLAGAHFRVIPLRRSSRFRTGSTSPPTARPRSRWAASSKRSTETSSQRRARSSGPALPALRLPPDAVGPRRALRPRAPRVERRPRGRASLIDADRSARRTSGTAFARDGPLLEREVPPARGPRARRASTEPMHGDLLWVYEGLTQYLGEILPRAAASSRRGVS